MIKFFIIGVARSGTTLLSLLLDGHSKIAIPNESHFITKYHKNNSMGIDYKSDDQKKELIKAILNEKYVKNWDIKIDVTDFDLKKCNDLSSVVNQLYSIYAKKHNKLFSGDKTPLYVTELDTIHKLFPDVKYIHLVRDGRDVSLSLKDLSWGTNNFISGLDYWYNKEILALKMLRMLPDEKYITIKFEDLIHQPEYYLEQICQFLGVEFEHSMLDNYLEKAEEKVGHRINTLHKNLQYGIMQNQAHKWQNELSPADQAIAFEKVGNLLKEFNYDLGVQTHPLKFIRKIHHRLFEALIWRLFGR